MRGLEFVILFALLPSIFAFTRHRIPAIPALWLLAAGALSVLLRDPTFDRSALWKSEALPRELPGILGLFAVAAAVFTLCIRRWAPHLLFNLPRTRPALWLAILCLYPVFSVYPQGLVYRAFLLHRYQPLFGRGALMILASAAAFGYVHIVFRNGWAVGLSALAGALFAWRYQHTGSLFVSSLEHYLYGALVFTVGLGEFFYHEATMQRLANFGGRGLS